MNPADDEGPSLGGLKRRIALHESLDAGGRGQCAGATSQIAHEERIADGSDAKLPLSKAAGFKVFVDPFDEDSSCSHGVRLEKFLPVVKGENISHLFHDRESIYLSMLKQLIRNALMRREMSMRSASLASGMSDSWLKWLLRSEKPIDPGILSIMRLCRVLEIPLEDMLKAAEADLKCSPREQRTLDMAIEAIRHMSPDERTRFLARQRPHKARH